jgi:hypothetical protein
MNKIPKQGRFLWFMACVLCTAGVLGWFWAIAISLNYSQHLPHSPNRATGRVYSLNNHGQYVYLTSKENSRLENLQDWSWGVGVCGAVLGAIQKLRSGSVQKV